MRFIKKIYQYVVGRPMNRYEEDEIAEARRSRKMRINAIKEKQSEKEKESSNLEFHFKTFTIEAISTFILLYF